LKNVRAFYNAGVVAVNSKVVVLYRKKFPQNVVQFFSNFQSNSDAKRKIRMFGCNQSEQQKWERTASGALKNKLTGLCLQPAMVGIIANHRFQGELGSML
jgi:predicted GH43/DUF377 family glycosyl hydrolase